VVGSNKFGGVWIVTPVLAALVFGLLQQMLFAQTGASTRDGVYTSEQAQQGKTIYAQQCASCHGAALEGKGKNPPLTGDAFLTKWTGQTLADLFMKTNTTMPAADPGSLTPDDTSVVLAYILSVNKLQPGKHELPTDPQVLGAIQIVKP
jgi:mono/diheme cytochrome c family protein